jgi:hypothetical protein
MTTQAASAPKEQAAAQSSVSTTGSWTRWMFYEGPASPLCVCAVEKGRGEIPPAPPVNERGEQLVGETRRIES